LRSHIKAAFVDVLGMLGGSKSAAQQDGKRYADKSFHSHLFSFVIQNTAPPLGLSVSSQGMWLWKAFPFGLQNYFFRPKNARETL
jgi:hypothetical protein